MAGLRNWESSAAASGSNVHQSSPGATQDGISRPKADAENLDLSQVFHEAEAPEESASSNFSFVCPQGATQSQPRNEPIIRHSERLSIDGDRGVLHGPEAGLLDPLMASHNHSTSSHVQNAFVPFVNGSPIFGVESTIPVAYFEGEERASHHPAAVGMAGKATGTNVDEDQGSDDEKFVAG